MELHLNEIGYYLILLRRPRNFFTKIVMPMEVVMFTKIVDRILEVIFMVMVLIISVLGTLIVGL